MIRSTTSEYQPAPPYVNLGGKQNGRFSGNVAIKTTVNMCCAPATNGDRIAGLAPSQPLSAKAGKAIRPRMSGT